MRYRPRVPALPVGRRALRLVFEELPGGGVSRRWVAKNDASAELVPEVRDLLMEAVASFDADMVALSQGRTPAGSRAADSKQLADSLRTIGGSCTWSARLLIWTVSGFGYSARVDITPKLKHLWTVERQATGSRMQFEVQVRRGDDVAAVGRAIDDLSLWMATDRWLKFMRSLRDGYRKIVSAR